MDNRKEEDKPPHNQIVNYFFVLKGWDYKTLEFYRKNKIYYGRYVAPAKKLLTLCDGDVKRAKECLDKISRWAESRKLNWAIETIFKKWLEIDKLEPKEKEPYFKGMRMIKNNNKWYCLNVDGRWLEFVGSESKIIYK